MFDEEVLLQQIGGMNKLRTLIGAYNFIKIKNGIAFKFKMCKEANYCAIKYLENKDLYAIEFLKINKKSIKSVKTITEIYPENLVNVFENFTGLSLSL